MCVPHFQVLDSAHIGAENAVPVKRRAAAAAQYLAVLFPGRPCFQARFNLRDRKADGFCCSSASSVVIPVKAAKEACQHKTVPFSAPCSKNPAPRPAAQEIVLNWLYLHFTDSICKILEKPAIEVIAARSSWRSMSLSYSTALRLHRPFPVRRFYQAPEECLPSSVPDFTSVAPSGVTSLPVP